MHNEYNTKTQNKRNRMQISSDVQRHDTERMIIIAIMAILEITIIIITTIITITIIMEMAQLFRIYEIK